VTETAADWGRAVRALRDIAFQLERAQAPTYRVRARYWGARLTAEASGKPRLSQVQCTLWHGKARAGGANQSE
jgi:hypothetical protein